MLRTLSFLALAIVFTAHATEIKPVIPDRAHPLPLSAVRVTGGPLKRAQDLDADYLLKLEPDRMLYLLRERAGLKPKAERGYGGWDAGDRQLTGHICGHYLSAVSYMWQATGDVRFKERADYIVSELKEIQDKHGDGYIGALMGNDRPGQRNGPTQTNTLVDGKILFQRLVTGTIASGGFDLNGMWSPWYVQHKLYAGLRDAYRFTSNRTALEVEVKFAAWADGLLSQLTKPQIQRMLATEFGAMNEIMVDLYADTGDVRWLKAADYFQHDAIIDPLARHEDILAGKHGNTQVPKLFGSLTRYVYTGETRDGFAAGFFWDRVAQHHSFVTGGHGRNEYFGQPDKLNDMVDGRTAETCNVYNMIKMARRLFALSPDAHYADFHERALFNHILGSIDPENGNVCYMVCVGQSPQQREYERDMTEGGFTCCVGSSMESHALHGDGLYYEAPGKLWVNLYVPSTATSTVTGAKLEMETGFPENDTATLKLSLDAPKEFTLALRRPYWAGEGFNLQINGEAVSEDILNPNRNNPTRPGSRTATAPRKTSSYVELKRTWKTGDTVQITLPKSLALEALPDNPRRAAVMWGPLVLAGDLGAPQPRRSRDRNAAAANTNSALAIPIFLAANKPVAEWIKPVAGEVGHFRSEGVGRETEVDFVPFYRLHRRTYGVYWNLFTPEEWAQRATEFTAAQEKQKQLEAITVTFAQPGQMQTERDFNQQGEDTQPVQLEGRYGRRGSKWFSFDLPVDSSKPLKLILTFSNDEMAARSFDILADGTRLGEHAMERRSPEQITRIYDVEYPLPANLVQGKEKITVRFEAKNGNEIAAVYGLRIVRGQ